MSSDGVSRGVFEPDLQYSVEPPDAWDSVRVVPFLGRNDVEMIVARYLSSSTDFHDLQVLYAREATRGVGVEVFVGALVRHLAENGCRLNVVRTKENGVKLITRLDAGFTTTVFDVPF